MSTERRLSRSFHSCLKGSSTEEAADDEESCYHSLGGRHSLNRQPQVCVEDLSNYSLADFESTQDENNGQYIDTYYVFLFQNSLYLISYRYFPRGFPRRRRLNLYSQSNCSILRYVLIVVQNHYLTPTSRRRRIIIIRHVQSWITLTVVVAGDHRWRTDVLCPPT